MEQFEQSKQEDQLSHFERVDARDDIYKIDTVIVPRRLRLRYFLNKSFGIKRKFFQGSRPSHSFHKLKVKNYLHLRKPLVDTYH